VTETDTAAAAAITGIRCTADRPAASSSAVVFACDRGYAPFAQFAAWQIARLNPDRDFDIVVSTADPEMTLAPALDALGVRLCRIETGALFDGLKLDRRSVATYFRLALPEALSGDYRRLLYLDSDVYVQGGDFAALLGLDLGGRPVAAVRDNIQWRTPERRPEEFRRVGLPTAPYFNAGVLLIDVPAWRAQRVLARCLEAGAAHPKALVRLDQSLLNIVLHGGWAELAPCWNWQYTRASMLFEAMEVVHVVHFIGPKKPWRHIGGALPLKYRRAYRSFLARHFPEAAPIGEDGLPPHRNCGYLRQVLSRHFLAVQRFTAYLGRFETDLTVLRT
jgi:lipopolysaccharide biosynthesis glycosyltransferase